MTTPEHQPFVELYRRGGAPPGPQPNLMQMSQQIGALPALGGPEAQA